MTALPRKTRKRIETSDHARFLTFSCYRNRQHFRRGDACGWFIGALARARETHGFALWAFVVMPDHVHLLIRPRGSVSPVLQSIKQSVSRTALHTGRSGDASLLAGLSTTGNADEGPYAFWQRGGGYDRNLYTPQHIRDAIDYIHMNPVNAGLVKTPDDWAWSSLRGFRGADCGVPLDLDCIPAA